LFEYVYVLHFKYAASCICSEMFEIWVDVKISYVLLVVKNYRINVELVFTSFWGWLSSFIEELTECSTIAYAGYMFWLYYFIVGWIMDREHIKKNWPA